ENSWSFSMQKHEMREENSNMQLDNPDSRSSALRAPSPRWGEEEAKLTRLWQPTERRNRIDRS
ncbi:hypothetical protein, partial [Rhizobium leguminosarum]|uniref:hypothetical protein n=1 Tax=Rhizobium leguminosarum TaxID=384 RepID=UPI00197DA30B